MLSHPYKGKSYLLLGVGAPHRDGGVDGGPPPGDVHGEVVIDSGTRLRFRFAVKGAES
jgi:hypothetical protein